MTGKTISHYEILDKLGEGASRAAARAVNETVRGPGRFRGEARR